MIKANVVIADRSATYRTLVSQEFDPSRFVVHEAANGDEAIQLANKLNPVILTVSRQLPGKDGLEVCRAIVSNASLAGTTVVMITGNDSTVEREQAFEAGAVRFLTKGFTRGELALYTESILRRRGQLAGLRILVVDDSNTIRSMITRVLESEGAIIREADDGTTALIAIAEPDYEPDVILTDFHMPNMDGIQLVEAFRRENTWTPVLFLSASEGFDAVARALDAGASDFIRKPFEATELLARIRSFAKMAAMAKELHTRAITDSLTGLFNRGEAFDRLESLFKSARKSHASFSCILIDCDHFKNINDTYGHHAGDEVLRMLAKKFKKHFKMNDSACRIGGEEFLILCPSVETDQALAKAETLRKEVENETITCDAITINVTISLGVASFHSDLATFEDLIKQADIAVYEAKNTGRNKVVVASRETPALSI